MEEKVYEMLVKMQSTMDEMQTKIVEMNSGMNEMKTKMVDMNTGMEEMNTRMVDMNTGMEEMNTRLNRVEHTVNRIEASQTEVVVGMLKVTKKNTDFEVDYLNNKITEIDKRLFSLEKRVEN